MIRNGCEVYESDLKAIFKRLDINKDGRVSYSEFRQLFNQSENRLGSSSTKFYESNLRTSPIRSLSPQRNLSPLRTQNPLRSTNYSFRPLSPIRTTGYTSPVRTSGKYYSPRRLYSPVKRQSPLRTTDSFAKSYDRSFNYKVDDQFVDYARELIRIENDLDRTKTDLALRSDFNIEDAFRLFELDARGYLTDIDFKYGLNRLDIFPTIEEIKLVFTRYDLANSGVLKYLSINLALITSLIWFRLMIRSIRELLR
jgi:Ca2+-binding EF-hand superfamily protein